VSNSPGAYITHKARHDRNVAEQFHTELAGATSNQSPDELAGLIGLAQAWLGDLLTDAESSGLSDLAAAVHAARAAACSDTDPLQATVGLEPALVDVVEALRALTDGHDPPDDAANPMKAADPESAAAPPPSPGPALPAPELMAGDSREPEFASEAPPESAAEPEAAEPQTVVEPSPQPERIAPTSTIESATASPEDHTSDAEPEATSPDVEAARPESSPEATTSAEPSDPISALDRLARQLEEMCPRWGVTSETPAQSDPVDGSGGEAMLEAADVPETHAPACEARQIGDEGTDAPTPCVLLDESPVPTVEAQTPPVQAVEEACTPVDQAATAPSEEAKSCDAEPEPVLEDGGTPSDLPAPVNEPKPEVTALGHSNAGDEESPRPEPALAPALTRTSDQSLPTPDVPVVPEPETAAPEAGVVELTPEQVTAMSAGPPESAPFSGDLTPEQMAALMAEGMPEGGGESWGSTPLNLPPERLESLQFLVAGVSDHFKSFRTVIWELSQVDTREDGAGLLRDCARTLGGLTGAFTLTSLSAIRDLLASVAEGVCVVPEAAIPELLVRVAALGSLIDQALRGLEVGMEVRWPLETIAERVALLLRGGVLHPDLQGWHAGDLDRVLELDRVSEPFNNPPTPETSIAPPGSMFASDAGWRHVLDRRLGTGDRRAGGDAAADRRGYGMPTLRVPVASVERMAAMVADLVQTKNILTGVIDKALAGTLSPSDLEAARSGSADLARLSSGLDVTLTMMQVRLQAISHLFDRFPRVLRDVASISDKAVELRTEPGDVQIDKQLFDALSDPLGQLLRCMVTRWIQPAAERAAAGRPSTAVINLAARSKGTRVLISITHDGARPSRQEIIERAVELDMLTPGRAEGLSDSDLMALLFDEHYCDPELSKVAAGLKALGGSVSVVIDGDSTTLVIAAPLIVAVLDTIMVGVGDERYGLPVSAVDEITQVAPSDLSSVRGQPVLRRRDGVVGVIDLPRVVRGDTPDASSPSTAVVIRTERHRAAVLVSAVLAKQEVVVRALDRELASARIFSGATISGDGRVNLILDVDRLAEQAADGPASA
jgi:chemotaxis protein histidine kinase CheA